MQIVIPMSGFGERFRRAGYTVPKPLISIEGKPMIAHVIDLFPGETCFIFICNQEHLDTPEYQLAATLKKYCPTGQIVAIAPHKLGPVHAVLQAEHCMDLTQPVIVNYCDFSCLWDWQHFKHFVQQTACVGAIPAYRGFHPHTLGHTNYAYMRERDGWVLAIQEKQPYTDNRMQEYASSGTYYFNSGQTMLTACRDAMQQNLHTKNEFYVSLTYLPLLAAQQPVAVYPLQHFMQWGTPEDVAEYKAWSATFKQLIAENKPSSVPATGSLIIPMAGLGMRFARAGHTETKPLISVSGLPMVLQAVRCLPQAQHTVFVVREDMPNYQHLANVLQTHIDHAMIKTIKEVTDGQARTTLIGLDALVETTSDDCSGPVTVGACDFGALYDRDALQALFADNTVDVIVWGVRGHSSARRQPQMFGWIDEQEGVIQRISVKVPLANPATDPIVLGTFSFRNVDVLRRCLARLFARDAKVKNEYYLDTVVNDALALGLNCRLFEVDHYMSWGTPDDWSTFNYWQSCFHQWAEHPYCLQADPFIPKDQKRVLEQQYQVSAPVLPIRK